MMAEESKSGRFEILEYRLPAHWAGYLINSDATGFDIANTPDDPDAGTREQSEVDGFVEHISDGKPVSFTDCSEPYFSHYNDANNLGGDVCDFTVLRYLSKPTTFNE
tara:strand:+ start:460 stop:780 length:321 start_codon:yes stop_codon:yes gene_type:complete